MQPLLDWLTSLPPLALYLALAVAAAIENVFPPFPADTVVAFGSFYAARVNGSVLASFLSTLGGNLAGAMGVYWLGRRYGMHWLEHRFKVSDDRRYRMVQTYNRYGAAGLFVSRFLPGVRAIVPPLAGALGVPAGRAAIAMGTASAVWYGIITWLAFSAGNSWEELSARIARMGRGFAIGAAVLVLVAVAAWLVMRRRRRA
jgi:membrane protein DedA with SNARE-associated domain